MTLVLFELRGFYASGNVAEVWMGVHQRSDPSEGVGELTIGAIVTKHKRASNC